MPIAALAIPAIAGVAGGLLSKKGGSSNSSSIGSSQTSPLDPSILELNKSLKGLADYQLNQGQVALPKAFGALGQSENFYRTLLSGDRGAMVSLLGPQLNAIGQQGQAQQRSISQLLPRGGAITDRLGDLSTNTQGQINDQMLNYRPAAAQSLAGIGGEYANLGSGLLGGAGASLSGGLSSLLNQRGQDINAYLEKYRQSQENHRALGAGIGGLISILLGPGGILNPSKGGGG